MPSGKLTRSQKNFIEKLSENSPKRMEEVQHFLVEKGAGSLDELSVPDASALIEKLKSQSEPSGIKKSPNATKKQISFVKNLQTGQERLEFTEKFLKEHGLGSLDELSMADASSLIESLKNIRSEEGGDYKEKPATPKQLDFIDKLQATDREKKVVQDFLAKMKKKSLDDLTSREASNLIERLKS